MSEVREIRLTVNGKSYQGRCEPRKLLVDFVREDLGLTGTHIGCEHGICGACTILFNGEAARSCLMFAVQATGRRAGDRRGTGRMATSFTHCSRPFTSTTLCNAAICTPGMLIAALDFLATNPAPTEDEIREGISSVLCRCTGYVNIVKAVAAAAEVMRAAPEARARPMTDRAHSLCRALAAAPRGPAAADRPRPIHRRPRIAAHAACGLHPQPGRPCAHPLGRSVARRRGPRCGIGTERRRSGAAASAASRHPAIIAEQMDEPGRARVPQSAAARARARQSAACRRSDRGHCRREPLRCRRRRRIGDARPRSAAGGRQRRSSTRSRRADDPRASADQHFRRILDRQRRCRLQQWPARRTNCSAASIITATRQCRWNAAVSPPFTTRGPIR